MLFAPLVVTLAVAAMFPQGPPAPCGEPAGPLTITSTWVIRASRALAINGVNFGGDKLQVTLDGLPLEILSCSSEQILAAFRPQRLLPGSYLLTVSRGERADELDRFSVTLPTGLGAADAPAGPPAGMSRPAVADAGHTADVRVAPVSAGRDWIQPLRVVDRDGKEVGFALDERHVAREIDGVWVRVQIDSHGIPDWRGGVEPLPLIYRDPACESPAYVRHDEALIAEAYVWRGLIFYPSTFSPHGRLDGFMYDPGGTCGPVRLFQVCAAPVRVKRVSEVFDVAPPFAVVR